MARKLNASCKAKGPLPQRIEAVLDYIAQDASQALGTKRAYRKREAVPKGNAKDQEGSQGADQEEDQDGDEPGE